MTRGFFVAGNALANYRVLLVDDEPFIRALTARLLGEIGCGHFIEAGNGREALGILDNPEAHIDVILCDLMMPEMSGMELFSQIGALAPDQAARVVFVTGGAFTDRAREFLARTSNPRLEKPFETGAVRALVARVIDGPSPGTAPSPAAPPANQPRV